MLKIRNIIQYAIIVLCASAIMISCTKEDKPGNGGQYAVVKLSFSTEDLQTKATLPDSQEAEINSLRIYAYTSGRKVGYFHASPVPAQILMDIEVISGGNSQDVTFYVIANEDAAEHAGGSFTLDENTTLAGLQALSFTSLDMSKGLPMFGSKTESIVLASQTDEGTVSNVPGHEGHIISQSVTIPVKRAVAKLDLNFAKAAGMTSDLTVNQVTVIKEGAKVMNYFLPQSAEVLANVSESGADVAALAAPVAVTSEVSFTDVDGSHGIADASKFTDIVSSYAFENPSGAANWYTPAADGKNFRLLVDYTVNGMNHSRYIHLPAIERNCSYVVNAVVGESEGQIYITWDVADWNGTDEWVLEFNYPSSQNPLQPSSAYNPSTGKYENPVYGPAQMYHVPGNDEEGAFCVDFQMTAPVGQKWQPTFSADASDYAVRIYLRGTTTLVYDSGSALSDDSIEASENWYTIKVVPLKAENIGREVRFAITYKPTWMSGNDFLIINGTDSDPFWTGTGADSEVIVIKQIEKK